MLALKLSPACEDALDRALSRRIGIGVPSGNFVAAGTSVWLGDIPLECGWRSKGKVCESELAPLPAGGRPHAHSRMSIETETIRSNTM
jgi:hypothetical protein